MNELSGISFGHVPRSNLIELNLQRSPNLVTCNLQMISEGLSHHMQISSEVITTNMRCFGEGRILHLSEHIGDRDDLLLQTHL